MNLLFPTKNIELNLGETITFDQVTGKLDASRIEGDLPAEQGSYDNTESGLEATNVQDAIDEVNTKIENIPSVDAYTKEETDDKFATKTALEEVANAVSGKADASEVNQALGDLDEAVSGINNKFDDFTEILPVGKEWQEQEAVNSVQDKRATYNAQYQRITFANGQTYYACKVYPVTAGKYRIKGYGSDQNTTSVLAVVGNADIITSGASYCSLLQVIQTGSTTYGWHTVTVDIEQDGYLYVNYSYFSGDKTSTVEKEVTVGKTVAITDDTLTSEYLPANSKAVAEAIKNATQKNGIIKNGTTYQHFSYSHDDKYIFRTIAPVGANGLYDYKSVAVGHFEDGSAVIDTTFFTAFTDQIGPVSMRLSGDSGSNLWTGGVHTKNIGGTEYPTAQVQSIAVYVDGVDISNSEDGIYFGDCRIITKNNLYASATITGADLSTATLAIVETRTFILTDTLKVQVKLEFKESSIVGLYYGMQNQDNHTNTILLPTAGLELVRADMSSGMVSNSKEWEIMLSDNNNYHFDMLLD